MLRDKSRVVELRCDEYMFLLLRIVTHHDGAPNLVELEHTCQSHRMHTLEHGAEEAILEMTFISMDRVSRLIKSSFHLQST